MKCEKCGLKDDNEYRFMKYKMDGKIYCEVCVSDLAESHKEDWLYKNFEEINEVKTDKPKSI
jgi:late competence protein required for DNA uptake (superfamily II DNA/RNA helicase)